jgi:hypothetical protein
MPTIRVFLLTCRRSALLPRALASLRAQTFTDWICELHNDAPEDDFPRQLLAQIDDPRICLHQHEKNWGAVSCFNHACAGAPEPFFSILEDDNWWEPTFLEQLFAALNAHPNIELAWSNLQFWREETDGTWTNTQRTLWPKVRSSVVSIACPQLMQFDGPLHSNGAMLVRSTAAQSSRLQVPAWLPFIAMENLRERAFPGPFLLLTTPLVNFAQTRVSARSDNLGAWMQAQALMAAAFLAHIKLAPPDFDELWQARRSSTPPSTALLFFAGILQPTRGFFSPARLRDWLRFLTSAVFHPGIALAILYARHAHPKLWHVFDTATSKLANASTSTDAQVTVLKLTCAQDLSRALDNQMQSAEVE